MKTFAKILSAAACAAAVAALATSAEARPRKYRVTGGDVLVVKQRPFTDSGVVVPVNSRNAYVMQMTWFNYQPYERYSPGILWRPDPGFR